MRTARLLLVLLVLVGLFALAMRPEARRLAEFFAREILAGSPDRATPGRDGEEGARPAEARDPDAPGGTAAPAVRDVTPKGFTTGPTVTGPLVRVAPPPEPREEPQPRTERLFRPVVAAAGTIQSGKGAVTLPGIAAPGADETCGAPAWPCGRMARAALRRFIRGRAIDCDVPAGGQTLADATRCTVGGEDIAEWLVRQGWAKPDGEAYAAAAEAARSARLGIWGDRPR